MFLIKLRLSLKKKLDVFFTYFFMSMALVTIVVTILIVLALILDAVKFFAHEEAGGFPRSIIRFFTEKSWTPTFSSKQIGILPLLVGTFMIAFISAVISIPMGLIIAGYLSEFASFRVKEVVKPCLDFMEAIPTVVYGYFALLIMTPLLQWIFKPFGVEVEGMNALSPGIVLGFMILPFTASMIEDAFKGVPHSLREASYAIGASKIYTFFTVVLPAARSGVLAAYLLGISRALGETMVVAVASGMYPNITLNPFEPVQTITGYIVQVALGDLPFNSFEYLSIFAAGIFLFVVTLIFNLLAVYFKSKGTGY